MKIFSRRAVLSLIVVMAMMLGVTSITAMAAEPEVDDVYATQVALEESTIEIDPVPDGVASLSSSKGIYADKETLIYAGKGVDRWLHITPWLTPNTFTIRMVDYSGNTVWYQTFVTTGTTHWFVGSNVRFVYLKGLPGGVVDVTDTAN